MTIKLHSEDDSDILYTKRDQICESLPAAEQLAALRTAVDADLCSLVIKWQLN